MSSDYSVSDSTVTHQSLSDAQWSVLVSCSSEPVAPGDEEEVAVSPEPEVEKEPEAAVVELKSETMLESQTDSHVAEDQAEKSPAATTPPTEAASVPAEPAPAVPEENRVGLTDLKAADVGRRHEFSHGDVSPVLRPLQTFSWALVTSKNLPPSGAVPVSGIPPHVVKVTPTAPVGLLSPLWRKLPVMYRM